jgi:hypothetical protein
MRFWRHRRRCLGGYAQVRDERVEIVGQAFGRGDEPPLSSSLTSARRRCLESLSLIASSSACHVRKRRPAEGACAVRSGPDQVQIRGSPAREAGARSFGHDREAQVRARTAKNARHSSRKCGVERAEVRSPADHRTRACNRSTTPRTARSSCRVAATSGAARRFPRRRPGRRAAAAAHAGRGLRSRTAPEASSKAIPHRSSRFENTPICRSDA